MQFSLFDHAAFDRHRSALHVLAVQLVDRNLMLTVWNLVDAGDATVSAHNT